MVKFSFKKLPVDADGKAYDSMEDFQASELSKIIGVDGGSATAIAEQLIARKDARPAARGQKRPRKPKVASAELPLKESAA